jgi:energy-converting hydrogenase Eha subunit A
LLELKAMNEISWAEVVGSVGVPLLILAAVAGLFAALMVVAIIRTSKRRRRVADKHPTDAR